MFFKSFAWKLFAVSMYLITLVQIDAKSQNTGGYTQDELQILYDSTIILQLSGGFELNGEKFRYGIFRKNLKNELKRSTSAWESYKLYRKRSLLGTSLVLAAVPIFGIITASTLNPGLAAAAALPAYTGGTVLIGTATNYYQRSVWLYNRDAISGNLKDP